ncbi:cyclase [Rhodococcus sp. WMMA185]|uniref:SRPBCC family protein n=1 Tax=Rhodococcus sp. WMMA185 TaxID=679318 RepID=UPI000877F168|nr:SRPBCC family protein [Rhodococcus sp. WMMA185]AOW92851.1 cyclase [Rhodococcus sp. WMMA185]
MPERTKRSIRIEAPPSRVMDVIADFDAYPAWVSAAKSVEVVESRDDGRAARVRFMLDAGMVKDTYVLQYDWAPDGKSVSWELVSGEIQKSQFGTYALEETADGGTIVTYELTVDLTIPMIGLFKRKAEKVITDTALKELKKRVES